MNNSKGFVTILLLVLVVALGALLAGYPSHKKSPSSPTNEKLIVVDKKSEGGKGMLQIDKLDFITITPSPTTPPIPTQPPAQNVSTPQPQPVPTGNYCPKNTIKTPNCECEPGQSPAPRLTCTSREPCNPNKWPPETKIPIPCHYQPNKDSANGFETYKNHPDCSLDPDLYCASKPVIYLYPLEKTLVDVRIETPGKIYISDPLYPSGGWKNVEAYPNGTLYYQGKKYRELYYESTFADLNTPESGIIIPKEKLREQLKSATTKLGLNSFEQKEFLDYWVERLNKLNSPYILFSILDKEEKERVDRVVITPEPHTRIEFLAYFKPLTSPISLTPLVLPNNPPKRLGFTAVEWGGILDNN